MPILHPHGDYPEDEHQTRVACGDPVALAYEWIRAYAANLSDRSRDDDEGGYASVTADELIETAMNNIAYDSEWAEDVITKGPLLEGTSVDPTFWEKLAILKGIEIPQTRRNNFFSCSC